MRDLIFEESSYGYKHRVVGNLCRSGRLKE